MYCTLYTTVQYSFAGLKAPTFKDKYCKAGPIYNPGPSVFIKLSENSARISYPGPAYPLGSHCAGLLRHVGRS
jgi:hypothetical protein